jgi:hypothetical protein
MVDLQDPMSFYNKDLISPSITIFHSYAYGKMINSKYLKKHLVVCFRDSNITHSLTTYYDVDYATDLENKKSRSGYMMFLNNGPMS